jgi:hypothetical protein
LIGYRSRHRSGGGVLMKLTATHEPPRNVGGLQSGALNG